MTELNWTEKLRQEEYNHSPNDLLEMKTIMSEEKEKKKHWKGLKSDCTLQKKKLVNIKKYSHRHYLNSNTEKKKKIFKRLKELQWAVSKFMYLGVSEGRERDPQKRYLKKYWLQTPNSQKFNKQEAQAHIQTHENNHMKAHHNLIAQNQWYYRIS